MTNEEKKLDRFVSHSATCIKTNQCWECVHNIGKCAVFGDKPWKYADSDSTEKCPERKTK